MHKIIYDRFKTFSELEKAKSFGMSTAQIAKHFGITWATAQAWIKNMMAYGLIVKMKEPHTFTLYKLSKNSAQQAEKVFLPLIIKQAKKAC